jgi:antitoxin component YwqK of YwqJK toxin-antitoxin module
VPEKKRSQSNFALHTLNGVHEIFDPRGNIFVEARFEGGVMHGIYKEYYDEEKKRLKIEGRYEDGMKQGVWTTYRKKGIVEGVEIFNQGEILERTLYDDEEDK